MLSQLNTAIGQARLAARVRGMLGIQEDPNVKVGINGFGTMGRLIAHAIRETEGVDLVAINDPYIDAEYMAYMLEHDSVHGPYKGTVVPDSGDLMVDGRPVTVTSIKDPSQINWVAAGARYVVEASGHFDTPKRAAAHLLGGAHRVVVAAACGDAPQFVVGANHQGYNNEPLVSAGSAAAHCLALLARALDESVGLTQGCACVLLASRPQQLEQVAAGPSGEKSLDWRSGRGEGVDVIPAATAAATETCALLPQLRGKLCGATAFRVPAPGGVSVVDFSVELAAPVALAQLKQKLRDVAASPQFTGRLGYRDDAVGGVDFVGDGRSCVIDANSCLAVSDTFVKIVAWFANEWPYAKRLVELLLHMQAVEHGDHSVMSADQNVTHGRAY
jgi:glyceraldehyde 3-phosphate dehydrogenase